MSNMPRVWNITINNKKDRTIASNHVQFISIKKKKNRQEKDWYVHFLSNASPVARAIMRLAEES